MIQKSTSLKYVTSKEPLLNTVKIDCALEGWHTSGSLRLRFRKIIESNSVRLWRGVSISARDSRLASLMMSQGYDCRRTSARDFSGLVKSKRARRLLQETPNLNCWPCQRLATSALCSGGYIIHAAAPPVRQQPLVIHGCHRS